MLDRLYAAFAGLLVLLWLCVAVSCSFFLWQDRKDKRILVEACAALGWAPYRDGRRDRCEKAAKKRRKKAKRREKERKREDKPMIP